MSPLIVQRSTVSLVSNIFDSTRLTYKLIDILNQYSIGL